jgi:hypothetical protein
MYTYVYTHVCILSHIPSVSLATCAALQDCNVQLLLPLLQEDLVSYPGRWLPFPVEVGCKHSWNSN